VHESSSTYRPPKKSAPIAIPTGSVVSPPHTPTHGKGQAHNPLEDTLFLNIGTGEDFAPQDTSPYPIVSESPSNIDINVYETAYREEVQRIKANSTSAGPQARRPTLYLTRRVEHAKSLRDKGELIYDSGRTRDEIKASLKTFVKKAQSRVDDRAELQRLEGKEDLLSRGWRGVKQLKESVDEAREIVREEERREGRRPASKEREDWERAGERASSETPTRVLVNSPLAGPLAGGSRSGTPVLATGGSAGTGPGGSRSGTPVGVEKVR
jgi:[calcium/calmodulin-dependent protein kinase] kinase